MARFEIDQLEDNEALRGGCCGCCRGPRGPQGETGATGPQGERGRQGERGLQGPQGIQGERGERGRTGLQGEPGPQGERGLQGERGRSGPQGERGIQGIQGERGERGERGRTGPQGEPGIQGPQGEPGGSCDTHGYFFRTIGNTIAANTRIPFNNSTLLSNLSFSNGGTDITVRSNALLQIGYGTMYNSGIAGTTGIQILLNGNAVPGSQHIAPFCVGTLHGDILLNACEGDVISLQTLNGILPLHDQGVTAYLTIKCLRSLDAPQTTFQDFESFESFEG